MMTKKDVEDIRTRIQMAESVTMTKENVLELLAHIDDLEQKAAQLPDVAADDDIREAGRCFRRKRREV